MTALEEKKRECYTCTLITVLCIGCQRGLPGESVSYEFHIGSRSVTITSGIQKEQFDNVIGSASTDEGFSFL